MIDPIGNAPIFLNVTAAQGRVRKLHNAIDGTTIVLFAALFWAWILPHCNITETAFKIAGGVILFLVALDMRARKRQQCKRAESAGNAAD